MTLRTGTTVSYLKLMATSTPVLDYAGGLFPGTAGFAPANATVSYTIASLADIQAVVTTGLGTGSILKTYISQNSQEWQLTAGAVDPADPTGQVRPNDYSVSNNRYWRKVL